MIQCLGTPRKKKDKTQIKTRNDSGGIITEPIDFWKGYYGEYYAQLYANKCNYLNEMHMPLKTQFTKTDSGRNRKFEWFWLF